MVSSDTSFIGTPNNALLKLPPEDDDDELYISDSDPDIVDMFYVPEDELDELIYHQINMEVYPDSDIDDQYDDDDDDDEVDHISETDFSDELYVESANTSEYTSESEDGSTDMESLDMFPEVETNSTDGS